MRTYPFALTAVLALAIVLPSRAAEKPRPVQGNQNQPKKIWTDDDMDQLRARGLISITGPEVNGAAAPAAAPATTEATAGSSAPSFPVYESRFEDPTWYAQKAADLQAELDQRQAALQQEQLALAQAADRITQPGIAMDKPSVGVTPAAALAILQAQVSEVQSELDELSDLARQHDIPPGVLRS